LRRSPLFYLFNTGSGVDHAELAFNSFGALDQPPKPPIKSKRSRRLHEVEAALDTGNSLVDPIHSRRLAGELCLHMTNLGNDLPKASLDIRHAKLEIVDVSTCVIHRPAYVPKMLLNEIVYLFNHDRIRATRKA
jgi:hypothetical protein